MVEKAPPTELTAEQENELARALSLAEKRLVRDAFLALFGPPGNRTPMGAIAIKYLERFVGYHRPLLCLDANGRTDEFRYFTGVGRQQVVHAIHNMIEYKESDHVNPGSASPR